MAEGSLPQHRTCEICGEESPVGEFTLSAPGGRWIHAGPCFLEFGIIQNTLAGSAIREAVQRLGNLHRERVHAWKEIAAERDGRLKRALSALRRVVAVREFFTHRADTLAALLACEDVLSEGKRKMRDTEKPA